MSFFCARSHKVFGVRTLIAALLVASGVAPAWCAEKVLYSFRGGTDGASPYGTLIADGAGNLYGTTNVGGGGSCQFGGCGTVFKVAAGGSEHVLYAFTGGDDGAYPFSALISDAAGNFYGTAPYAGANGAGTIFMITRDGVERTLYPFQGGSDGIGPVAGLLVDQAGNLYGTTGGGGNNGSNCTDGCGTVFMLTPKGTKILLYAFLGGSDGWGPVGTLISDSSGNLYGMTSEGGASCEGRSTGCGTVFKIAPDGTETQLHVFEGGSDGYAPYAGLLADPDGNLYGTTGYGGSGGSNCPEGQYGCGTVFKLAPDGTETVLHAFQGGTDGWLPQSALISDKAGNLYGTTYLGGGSPARACHGLGCGTVFKLAPDGTETVLVAFGRQGRGPVAGLFKGAHGILYGTTTAGGKYKNGVVFSVKK